MNKKIRRLLKPIFNNSFFRRLLTLWKVLTSSWRVHLEKPVTLDELQQSREAASIPSFGFFFLLISCYGNRYFRINRQ